ncbi:MAG: hypothetical protein DPW09_32870 [Anaerolineae bacterium]|nr:hypothetical protein [Anaerolineae bacterium]
MVGGTKVGVSVGTGVGVSVGTGVGVSVGTGVGVSVTTGVGVIVGIGVWAKTIMRLGVLVGVGVTRLAPIGPQARMGVRAMRAPNTRINNLLIETKTFHFLNSADYSTSWAGSSKVGTK